MLLPQALVVEDPESEGEVVPQLLILGVAVRLGVLDNEEVEQPLEDPLVLPLSVLLKIEVWEALVQTVAEKEGDGDDEPQELKLGIRVAEPQTEWEAVMQAVTVPLEHSEGTRVLECIPLTLLVTEIDPEGE